MPAQHRGMDAPGELTQLRERSGDLAPRPIEPALRSRAVAELGLEQAQLEGERDKALLCPVVEVAL